MCRTFVFARENTAGAILEAIRARRTVVYGRDDAVYGDPDLIQFAEADGRLRAMAGTDAPTWLDRVSQVLGIVGFAVLLKVRFEPDATDR